MGQWSKLSAKEKAQIIKFAIDNGVSDISSIRDTYNVYASGGSIHIDKNKIGTFTATATKHGKSVQEFARQVLANKENYSSAMVRKAVFAHNSAKWHKHAGDSEESSYLRTKEGSAHPFIYSMLSSSMGQADNPMLTAINMLVNKYSKEPIVYTGSFYFGDKYGYGTEKKVPTNRNLVDLYVNGNEENFKRIYNPTPIVLDGDTLNYRQYEGTILPQDTIYLRPESKSTISRMTESKALLPINNSYPGFMSYSQKYNFLDSPYFLDKYYGKTIDDANNAQMSFKKDTKGNYYADVFDLWDLKGTDSSGIGNYIENQLATDTIENNGPFIIRQKVPIVFNRDSVSDGNFLNTISAKKWEKELDKDKHSTGGPLYPFSFQKNPYLKIPVVRYDEGGEIINWDNTITGKLINYVENSDSIGWNPADRTWKHPILPGYDKNQIGMGVDKNETPGYWDYIQYRPETNIPFLTELDERLIRHNAIEVANKSANARYKFAQEAVDRPKGTVSPIKDAAVVSAIYNLGAGYVANGLFEDKDFMLKLFDGTDKEVVDRINQEYKKKNRNERIHKTNAFLFAK